MQFIVKTGSSRDFRKYYYQYCKSAKILGFKRIPRNTHKAIIKKFHLLIMNEVIHNNFEFNLPAGLGIIKVGRYTIPKEFILDMNTGKFKNRGAPSKRIHWHNTKELWKKHPELYGKEFKFFPASPHGYKIMWISRPSSFKKSKFYAFRAMSQHRKALHNATLNPDYEAYGKGNYY